MATAEATRRRREELLRDLESVADAEGRIDPDGWRRSGGARDPKLMNRLFEVLDGDGDGLIDVSDCAATIESLGEGGASGRLSFAFELHDLDQDGAIDEGEFRELLVSCLAEQGLVIGEAKQDALVRAFFARADGDGDGLITRQEFKDVLASYPGLKDQLELHALSWLDSPGRSRTTVMSAQDRPGRRLRHAIQNHPSSVMLAGLWALVNVILFAHAMVTYADQGASLAVQIARGGGACLNFNGALILVPMLRSFWNALRSTRVGRYLPIDEQVAIHEIIAHAILFFTTLHVAAHLTNYVQTDVPIVRTLTLTRVGASGLLITVILVAMWTFARRRSGKPGRFEAFAITHALYGAWFIGLLTHGPVFWKWATVPLVGYAAERLFRREHMTYPTQALGLWPLPSDVTHLRLTRPADFTFSAGDFAYLKVPEISASEWHPFTISSAPENAEFLDMHVRTVGDWTEALNQLATTRAEGDAALEVELEGPFGTPSQRVFEAEVSVLIGAGIGVTPFASMLHSVLWRKRLGLLGADKKIHFIWISRTQRCFEWFAELLGELEQSGARDQVEIEIYMTGFVPDLTSAAVQVAIDSLYAETETDLITGLRARTRTGRPDWSSVGDSLADAYPGSKVEVFYCGPPGLGAKVRRMCTKHGLIYRSEKF